MANFEYAEDDAGYDPQARYGYQNAAQDDYHETDAAGGSRLGAMVNWAGALISLGLVVGMGVWAFQLTMRDVSGVPVIQALEGPMRVPPENPGGAQAPHQGLAVNRIAEGAEAEAVPDQLVLAPPPVDLEALPEIAIAPEVEAQPVETATDVVPEPAAVSAATQALIEQVLAEEGQLETELSADEATETAETTPEVLEPSSDLAELPRVIATSIPGVNRSLRPLARPASLQIASSSTANGAAASEPAGSLTDIELAVGELPDGTRLVQLGAFDSPDIARAEWQRLAERFPDFFAGRARVIEQASSGGQDFYRLRAHGFDDLAASRRFCAALMAQGAACIPVTVR